MTEETNNEKSILPEINANTDATPIQPPSEIKAAMQAPLVDVPIPTKEEEDEYAARRAKAARLAEENPNKPRIKAKIIKKVTTASAFGATSVEKSVEREVIQVPIDEKTAAIRAELDKQLTDPIIPSAAALITGVESGGMTRMVVTPEQLEKVKAMRNQMSGLWSAGVSKDTGKEYDHLIEGLPTDEHIAVKNPEAGDSGVRISFKGKGPRQK